jgi:DNA-binding PadR family transcriptional regulator
MDMDQLNELRFLLLLNPQGQKIKLADKRLAVFNANEKEALCRQFSGDGLIEFSRDIADTLTPAGQALLTLIAQKQQQFSENEAKVLEKLAATPGNLAPSKITVKPTAERDAILAQFLEQGYISVEMKTVKKKSTIATVEITDAGRELVNFPLSEEELQVLRNLAVLSGHPVSIRTSSKKIVAKKQDIIRDSFVQKGFIQKGKKVKPADVEVWLTENGQTCLNQLADQFQQMRKPVEKPDAKAVLAMIKDLDRELHTNNYLPIFDLRKKLQPPLSRTELDQLLVQLEQADQIELGTLLHSKDYTPEQLAAGIEQQEGKPLFFIQVL